MMRRGHFILLFFCLLLLTEWKNRTEQSQYERAAEQKQRIEQAMTAAMDASVSALADAQGGQTKQTLEAFSEHFFRAFTMCMDWEVDSERQKELLFYVPVLAVTQTEGFYLYSMKEVQKEDGSTEPVYGWSDCIPYVSFNGEVKKQYFLDEVADSMEEKQAAIVCGLEEQISRVLDTQSEIAKQYGINLSFRVPSFFDTFRSAIEAPSVIAIFHGWPLSEENQVLYHSCVISAAFLKQKLFVLTELPNRLEQPYAVMHKTGCEMLGKYGTVLQERCTVEEAVKRYGAYACEQCMGNCGAVCIP